MGQGAYIFGCQGPELQASEARFFGDADPWGFILFARNIQSPEQLKRLTGDLRNSVARDAPILIDQEGGRVQRMGPPHWRQWLPPLDEVALAGPNAVRSMYLRARIIAAELRAVGIDVNCTPCADIATQQTHPVLRNRCYGTDLETVVSISQAVADGQMHGGVLPILKHMPGHGRATLDSHLELPHVAAPEDDLQGADFAAFKALAHLPLGMSAHIVFDQIDPNAPSTTSRIMVRKIREQIGFDGLLMSDDISMQALAGTVSDRSKAALIAGIDLILHCNGDSGEMKRIAGAAGHLHGPAQARADQAIAARLTPDDADINTLVAEHDRLCQPAPQ